MIIAATITKYYVIMDLISIWDYGIDVRRGNIVSVEY